VIASRGSATYLATEMERHRRPLLFLRPTEGRAEAHLPALPCWDPAAAGFYENISIFLILI